MVWVGGGGLGFESGALKQFSPFHRNYPFRKFKAPGPKLTIHHYLEPDGHLFKKMVVSIG